MRPYATSTCRYLGAATRATREVQEEEMRHLEAVQALQRKLDVAETQREEEARRAGVQRAMLEEELSASRDKAAALKRAQVS